MSDASTSPTLGVVFLPSFAPERLKPVAQEADRVSLPELWLWEDCFKEGGLTAAAAALAWTERLRVGVGLIPVPLRNVAVSAMEIATLDRMFPSRLVMGVGHGVQEWMAQVGARAGSPMTLLREHTTSLRRLLAGELVSTSGRYVSLDDVQLAWPSAQPAPLLVGAVGPKTLALAGELAEGVILTGGTTVGQVRTARTAVDAAARAAGRGRPQIVVFLPAVTGPNAEERLAHDLAEWDPDGALDLMGVAGDVDVIAQAVRELADAGADSVILQPTMDEPDVEGYVRFVAQDLATALGRDRGPRSVR